MKLLFDQNISFRVINKIKKIFPEARHVRQLALENSTDKEIWEYAKENNYCIVTFDSDFYDINLIKGYPPKIIWLRFGNRSTNNLIIILIQNFELISEFIINDNYKEIGCLEIL